MTFFKNFFTILLFIFALYYIFNKVEIYNYKNKKENFYNYNSVKHLFIESYTQKIEYSNAYKILQKQKINNFKNLNNIKLNIKYSNKLNTIYKNIDTGNILLLRKDLRLLKNKLSKKSLSIKNKEKLKNLTLRLKDREQKELPTLRKTYSKYLKNKYSSKYIKVSINGNRNKTLILDWYNFASKSKRTFFFNNLKEKLKDFGFNKLILKGTINNKFYKSVYKIY
jgi:hypothetical protein